ncbi:MAG: hypothetical protein OEU26_36000, partial [Candidatus Tectomicrobia bacterium]|nr:hypothetical protein [Candidatus Tectomicrobia bacterium]
FLLLSRLWRGGKNTPAAPKSSRPNPDPKPFEGLTRKPECEACEQEVMSHPQAVRPKNPNPLPFLIVVPAMITLEL